MPDAVKKGSKESIIPILSSEVVTKDQIIYRGKESHGSTMIVFRKNYSSEKPSSILMKALLYILTERCQNKMRQESGDTYSPYVTYKFPLNREMNTICLYLAFSSTPEKAAGLKQLAMDVIADFVQTGPNETEILAAKEIIRQKVKEAKEVDGFWGKLHMNNILTGKPIEELLFERESLEMVTAENLQRIGKELLNDASVMKFSLFPEGA